jgi:peptidoglycan/xylan/chitin deacetylase (PgdA/CDA1 family)
MILRRAVQALKQLIFYVNDVSAALAYLAAGRRPRQGLTVLCYHRVADAIPSFPPYNPYNVSPANFAEQVESLRAMRGVKLVGVAEVATWLRNGAPQSGSYLLLTFDDCWDHTVAVGQRLAKAGVPGTFFIPTGYVGSAVFDFSSFDRWYVAQPNADARVYKPITEGGCQELIALGMDVQPHGERHLHLGTVPAAEMETDIARSIDFVQDRLGRRVVAFCYPFGSRHLNDYTAEVIEALTHTPAMMAFSTDAGVNRLDDIHATRYALRRIPVNGYDRGLLFEAKASGYTGALPALKAILHRATPVSGRSSAPASTVSARAA